MIAHAMSQLATELDQHRQALFGLCYRMLGSAADADDLVQDTFRRALERPPKDTTAPLRPSTLQTTFFSLLTPVSQF